MDGKKNPTICCLQQTHFKLTLYPNTHPKLKGWKEIFHANSNQKRAEVAMLKLDFK